MNITELKYVLETAATGSISIVTKKLCVAQSNIRCIYVGISDAAGTFSPKLSIRNLF